ncbi:dienelactone hydrolase, partial [Rhizobiaceae bacterium]|nr:dienelactone hydrolase [Rhizobiaceae bacterium]
MTIISRAALAASLTLLAGHAAAENRIDVQRPDAPELAAYGELPVGVRQVEIVNKDQIDIAKIDPAAAKPEAMPRYDRPLTLEVWYPAAQGATGETTLKAFLRDGKTEVELQGKAMRDAEPRPDETYPLVMISHGYPGNRFLLSHLAENLASKGYVVASIDHTDSTYRTQTAFGSTLVNRSFDQLFTLAEVERMSKEDGSFLNGLVDASNVGLIGYSMGGYGALITTGAGVTDVGIEASYGAPFGLLGVHKEGSETQQALPDARIKTAVTFGPWGMNAGFWDEAG